MRDPFEQVHRFVDSLLLGKKPKRFRVGTREDLGALRMAAALSAVGNTDEPSRLFVDQLRTRFAAAAGTPSVEAPSSRRGFLAAGLAGLATGLGAAAGITRLTQSPATPAAPAGSGTAIVRENGRWFPIARLSQMAEHATVRFSAGALEGNLVRRCDQDVALSSVCIHLPCSLVWREHDDDFLCPCHDASFTAAGEPKASRRPYGPLTRFETKVEGDQVMVWSIGNNPPQEPGASA